MIPKPSVASARNTPDNRMAGMAMIAPTGTAINPASRTAGSHGMEWSLTRWPKAAAPTAASPSCASDTWPDVRTKRPSDRNRITYRSATVHAASFTPTISGMKTSTPTSTAAATTLTRAGAVYEERGGGGGGVRRRASRRFGVTSNATNSTMNGILGGSPPSHVMSLMYLVDNAAAIPMNSPPT